MKDQTPETVDRVSGSDAGFVHQHDIGMLGGVISRSPSSYGGLCGVSTSTESTSAQSPTSCTMNPATCPYSHRLRSRIQTAGIDSGADRNATATWLFTGATTASQMPNASSRQQAPASVHPQDGQRLRTRNVSTAAITMEPTWYTPPTMARARSHFPGQQVKREECRS